MVLLVSNPYFQMKIGYVWSWQKISGHDFLVNGGPKADMRDITRAIIISHRVSAWNTICSAPLSSRLHF